MMVALIFFFISGGSFCSCLLRQKCQVLEKKYFAPFLDLNFNKCDEFEELDFTIAVHCDMVDNLNITLKEIPLETDWLCLTRYLGVTVQAEAFSQLTSLKSLSISGNTEFLSGAFTGLSQLSVLWIESETLRDDTTFHKDTFCGIQSLQILKICGINFSSFSFSIFTHLSQLDHLILENNNMTYFSELTTSLGKSRNLPNLHKLSVFNNIDVLREEDCFRSPYPTTDGQIAQYVDFNITFLEFREKQFSHVDPNSLCNFPHLEVFQAVFLDDTEQIHKSGIRTSKVISLPRFLNTSIEICKCALQFKVEKLLVVTSGLEEIGTFTGSCKTLRNLDLSYNFIKSVSSKQFQRLNNLLSLNLSNNGLENLDICQDESTPRTELVYLSISYNMLTRLYKGQFACLKKLQILSLENNNINIIEDLSFDGLSHLSVLNLQKNNLFTISNSTFATLFSLTHLNLNHNEILEHGSQVFKDLEKLQELMMTYDVDDFLDWLNRFRLPLKHLMANTKYMMFESEFYYGFSQLQVLELDVLQIFANCSSQYVFRNISKLYLKNIKNYECFMPETHPLLSFTNLERLYYTGSSQDFSDITLNSLKDVPLKFLYLEDLKGLIKYGQLNVHKLFQGLSKLKVLHLQNSGINNLDSKDMFMDLQQMEFLVIENQDIEEVNGAAFESMPNLKYIYFLQTTFPCKCKFKGLLSWLESDTRVSIINFHNQSCQINQNTSNLVSFLQSNCHTDLDLIMFVMTFVFTMLFMLTSLFYESIWWYILYLVYMVKCWLNHKQRDREHYEYDVFVSYNTHNEQWVTEQLLPSLEQNGPPFFRLCIHSRDFEVGRDIVENIMDSIYNSRWTLCVITRPYLHSNWCSLEMRMATYRLFDESKDSLILVFLDEISREELQHYHRLTKLLDKKTYLDWPDNENGQRLFWTRLQKVIAKSGRKTSVKK